MSERSDAAVCQINGCARAASGRYTRPTFAASDGEEWPDDVSERPICWRHHWFEESFKYALTGVMFGAAFGLAWGVMRVVA